VKSLLALLAATALATTPELRKETRVDFEIDAAFQSDGGIQFFYAFEPTTAAPAKGTAWARFRPLDDKATASDAYHAVMSRIVYTVERDVSYFTEARARDTGYLAAVAPEAKVTAEKDGSFRAGRMPTNRFTITWHEPAEPTSPTLAPLFAFLPPGVSPASVVVQRNSDFARVMGWRTAERSITYTAHEAIGPGRTRIHVCTVSLLHHVPPFFLGGKDRVYREAVDETKALIEALRDYRGP
jgi:hypothetical protein